MSVASVPSRVRVWWLPRIAGAFLLAALIPAVALAAPNAAAAPCSTSGLVVWLNTNGDNAAGSSYYNLKFTNLSGHACTLRGYPGVSAVDLHGTKVGSAAGRDTATAAVVRLANGATASAVLRITVAGNFPSSTCHPVTAAGLRVYPPGQTASRLIPFPFEACSKSGPLYLTIRPVT